MLPLDIAIGVEKDRKRYRRVYYCQVEEDMTEWE